MRARTLYRVAAGVLVLFAALHTFGFLSFRPTATEGRAVWDAMNRVHFVEQGSTFNYAEFYVGLGLYVTGYLLFSAYLAWFLGDLVERVPGEARMLRWAFCGLQVVGLVIAVKYIGAPPAIFSGFLSLWLGWAAKVRA